MMKWNACRFARREIDQSELRQQLSERTRMHIASCTSCQAFRDQRVRLRELVGGLAPVAAPADFEARLRTRMAKQAQGNSPRSFFAIFPVSAPAIAVAAAMVIFVASVAWFIQHRTNQTVTVASQAPAQSAKTNSPLRTDSSFTNAGTDGTREVVPSAVASKKENGPSHLMRGRNTSRQFREASAKSTQAGVTSKDFSVQPAKSIKQGERNSGEVSLSAPLKPLVLSLQDGSGGTRKISLPAISFGSQRLMEGRAVPVNSTNARIW